MDNNSLKIDIFISEGPVKPFLLADGVPLPTEPEKLNSFVQKYALAATVLESHPNFAVLPRVSFGEEFGQPNRSLSENVLMNLMNALNVKLEKEGFLLGKDRYGFYYVFLRKVRAEFNEICKVYLTGEKVPKDID